MNYLQKELEEILQMNSSFLEFINSPDTHAYWLWDLDTFSDKYYSDSFFHYLGYKDAANLPTDFWKTIIHKDDLEYCYFRLTNYLSNPKGDFDQIIRYAQKNGNNCWIKCIGKIVYNEKGNPSRMIGIVQNKTRLQDLEDYKTLLEETNKAAKIGSWELNLIEETVYWNTVTKEIHETPSSFSPTFEKAFSFFSKEEDKKKLTIAFNKAREEGSSIDEDVILKTEQGKEKWVRVIGTPFFEAGRCYKIHGLLQDIDQTTRSHIKLQHQEELFRTTFENASIGMALVGLNGEWLKVNSSLCGMLGYTEEELYATNFQKLTHHEDVKKDLKLAYELLDGINDSYETEKRYYHKNGNSVWASISVSLIRNTEGTPLHFISQITDITQKKLAAEKVESLLNVTTDQNKRLLNFAHIVSHNLRSHSGNLAMLMDLMKVEHPEFQENEFIPLLHQAVDNLSETIQHLNEVVLVHTQNRKDIQYLNLRSYIEKAISSINGNILDTKTTIINSTDTHIEISYIPAYLDSVLLNLLSNAIKYKKPNVPPIIEISSKDSENFHILSIKDNGLGIDLKAHSHKIFGMYKTFHSHEDARGVGLFLTKNQVEAMDGKITVESEVGEGSTFKVFFKK
ncbi:PAS domain S-box-containing protein [Pustulibacterium marinum]|uniref:histidine kinase n=1 Tax=Pustulibacterium marinum TaxID=1224947 RepID=A0A1I7GMB9_9FLAO|nr:PAS domain S-box protein [Pustulibacterium marinum]SFU49559.1 PAS domain S-box-containing protein [Pustulibacterium marinum]